MDVDLLADPRVQRRYTDRLCSVYERDMCHAAGIENRLDCLPVVTAALGLSAHSGQRRGHGRESSSAAGPLHRATAMSVDESSWLRIDPLPRETLRAAAARAIRE